METVFLSRLQFGLTTMFHILFPVLTIGLAVYLVVIELLWLKTKRGGYSIYTFEGNAWKNPKNYNNQA